jgi:hypothetical protein
MAVMGKQQDDMDAGLTSGGQRQYGYYLGPIGAHLDLLGARHITIAEIEDGFIWHCYARETPLQPIAGVLAFTGVADLVESVEQASEKIAREREAERQSHRTGWLRRRRDIERDEGPPHPLFPMGYEETLRSIGVKLEEQRAYCPLLAEREASLLVIYSLPLPSYIRLDVSKMETFTGMHEVEYLRDDLTEIIELYRDRRNPPRY